MSTTTNDGEPALPLLISPMVVYPGLAFRLQKQPGELILEINKDVKKIPWLTGATELIVDFVKLTDDNIRADFKINGAAIATAVLPRNALPFPTQIVFTW